MRRHGARCVGDDLDDAALLVVLRLVGPLLEPAGDHDAGALGERRRGVLAERTPAHDVEEARLLLPLVVHLVAAGHRDAERGDGAATGGEPELRVAGEVAGEGDG